MKKAVKIFGLFSFGLILMSGCDNSQSIKEIEQFVQIDYKYNFNNKLNTFEGYYQKDLIIDGVAKTKFWLIPEHQQRILDKAESLGFFDFPDELNNESCNEECVVITPNSVSTLRIKHGALDHQTKWKYIPEESQSAEYKKARELGAFIHNIIETYPQYKKLPEPKGGYL